MAEHTNTVGGLFFYNPSKRFAVRMRRRGLISFNERSAAGSPVTIAQFT